jgi:hypothetical protein
VSPIGYTSDCGTVSFCSELGYLQTQSLHPRARGS